MNNLTIAVQTIKDSVSALDVGEALGLEIRHGRCRCPIHGGSDFNCVLYKGDRGYYCHVCKSGGDVISFVREYNKTSFKESIAWIDGTFSLGLNINSPVDPSKQKAAEMAIQRRKRARELQEWKEKMQFDMALVADRITEKLEEVRDEHRPRTYGNWDEEFYMAVRLLPEAREFTEKCELECIKERKT